MPRMSCNKEERNRSESGSVLMLTIIALVFLLGLGLLTIDAGRLYLMRHRADSIAKLAGKLAYMGRRGVCRAVDDPGNPSNHIADQQTNLLVQENVRLSSFLGIQPPVVQINYPDPTTRYEQEVQVGLAYQPTILRYLGLSSGYTIQVSAHKKSEIKPQAAILVSDNSNSMGSRISGPTSPVKLDMAKASLIAYLQTGLWALDQLAVIFSANFGDNVFPSSASSAQTFQGEFITPPLSCLNLELVRTDVINIVRGASTQATSATNISDVFRETRLSLNEPNSRYQYEADGGRRPLTIIYTSDGSVHLQDARDVYDPTLLASNPNCRVGSSHYGAGHPCMGWNFDRGLASLQEKQCLTGMGSYAGTLDNWYQPFNLATCLDSPTNCAAPATPQDFTLRMKAIGTAQAIIGADYLRDNFDARIHLLGLGQEDLTTIYRELQDAQNRNLVPRIFGLRLALDPMRRTDPLYMNRNPSRPSPAWGHDFTPCVQQNHQISPNAKEGSFRMFTNAAQLTDAYVTFAQVGDEIGFILP